MTSEDRELLRQAFGAGRTSAQRLALARAADGASGAFRVDALAEAARRVDPGIGSATAYRAVGAMVATGFLEQVGADGASALYARCDAQGHHHHLVCTRCGAVAGAPCPVGDAAGAHAAARGFTVTHHEVTLYGLCSECSRADGGAR